ncbi:hypothetical protein MSG28_004940 [Choristoneura fumiferana]|uniref:Uncharacterized protein n=1 Tax=Choristoneura fumiferana TaxID=7141 RepID=A0ACC0JP70_CHOFU|nr:hypothetical protein MSG28_004940 [Choristoneura fumiferana]
MTHSVDIASLECSYLRKESYPKIEDVISFTHPQYNAPIVPAGVIARNFSIDVEKLDIDKFRRNEQSFRKQILGDDVFDNDNVSIGFNDTRRALKYIFDKKDDFIKAEKLEAVTKIADIMLQTIYMARQKIKTLEREEVVKINKETKSYRVSYLYNNLRDYWKKISNIYMTMKDNKDQMAHVMHATSHDRKFSPWLSLNPFIILHHKAARVHVDFLKTWWIFVKVYERQGGRNTTPKESKEDPKPG